jgi:hypothetical protein
VALAKGYYVLEPRVVVIGRGPDCQVPVFHESVSRRHAQITREGASHSLVDLGSANGTFLNGKPVKGPSVLAHDDVIAAGKVVFRFLVVEGSRDELLARFDPRAEETERVVSSMASNAALAAAFARGELAALARQLEREGASGVLRVESGGLYGMLRFRVGTIVEAMLGAVSGEKAARDLLGLEQGEYAFYQLSPGAVPPAGGSLALSPATVAP